MSSIADHEQAVGEIIHSSNNKKPRLMRKWQWWILAGVLIASAVALCLTLTIFRPDSANPNASSNGEPDEELMYFRSRYMALRTALGNYSKPYLFYNPDSAQSKALQWLVFRDETLQYLDDDDNSNGQDEKFRLTQRYAYLVLYFACGGAQWKGLAPLESTSSDGSNSISPMEQYVVDTNECDWLGVQCGSRGQVTHLSLNEQGLIGPLPHEVGLLTHLTHLNLRGNELRGTLPAALGRFDQLESLALGLNKFWGPLPSALGQLTRLRHLDLYQNQLAGPLSFSILSKWTEMQELELSRNRGLSGPVLEMAAQVPWSQVQILRLLEIDINGTIPDTIHQFTELEELQVGGTLMSGEIPKTLTELTNLKILSIGGAEMENATFPTDIGKLSLLKSLTFRGTGIQGTIPENIGNLTDLEWFITVPSSLTGTIPTTMGLMKGLQYFDVSDSPLTGTIPPEIGSIPDLRRFVFRGTNLMGNVPDEVCNSLVEIFYRCQMTCNCCSYDCLRNTKQIGTP